MHEQIVAHAPTLATDTLSRPHPAYAQTPARLPTNRHVRTPPSAPASAEPPICRAHSTYAPAPAEPPHMPRVLTLRVCTCKAGCDWEAGWDTAAAAAVATAAPMGPLGPGLALWLDAAPAPPFFFFCCCRTWRTPQALHRVFGPACVHAACSVCMRVHMGVHAYVVSVCVCVCSRCVCVYTCMLSCVHVLKCERLHAFMCTRALV